MMHNLKSEEIIELNDSGFTEIHFEQHLDINLCCSRLFKSTGRVIRCSLSSPIVIIKSVFDPIEEMIRVDDERKRIIEKG